MTKKKRCYMFKRHQIFRPVMVDSGKMTVERTMRIQSLRTPATRIVTAPVLPITKNMAKFKASAHRALEKKIQKLNWICATHVAYLDPKCVLK